LHATRLDHGLVVPGDQATRLAVERLDAVRLEVLHQPVTHLGIAAGCTPDDLIAQCQPGVRGTPATLNERGPGRALCVHIEAREVLPGYRDPA
jgi:hypothetical protein